LLRGELFESMQTEIACLKKELEKKDFAVSFIPVSSKEDLLTTLSVRPISAVHLSVAESHSITINEEEVIKRGGTIPDNL